MATVISDGVAEDLIRAFVQTGCAENHTKTLLEKFYAELENGLVDTSDQTIVDTHIKKIDDTIAEIEELAEARRAMMLYLMEMYGGDRDYWCVVKHLGVGVYTMFEAYQASGDPALLNLALSANKRFVKALTRFLGTEITECAACFSDVLRAKSSKNAEDDQKGGA